MSENIHIEKNKKGLELHYYPESPLYWLSKKAKDQDEDFRIGRVFNFHISELNKDILNILIENSEDLEMPLILPFAIKEGSYYKIPGRRLGIKQDVFFATDIRQTIRNFRATRQVSIFKQFGKLLTEDIFIGGEAQSAITLKSFKEIIKSIPTEYELEKYISARISGVLGNYIETSVDAVQNYQRYLNKRPAKISKDIRQEFSEYELRKYREIQDRLRKMLDDENEYKEATWQEAIKDILLLIYPQYLRAFREAPIHDSRKGKLRSVDFLLVDSGGMVDLLEIKKPFDMAVVTAKTYRDNHIPLRELSGSVMQVEKYLFHLTRSGEAGERKLNNRFGKELPSNIKIKVTNPRGIVLIGRDKNLSSDQLYDFEVIRRKYKNVIDIITYDDLIRRLDAIIFQLRTMNN